MNSDKKEANETWNFKIKILYNKLDIKKLKIDMKPYLYMKDFKIFSQGFF